jgi:triphosphatase
MAKPKKIEGLDCAGGAAEGVRLTLASRFAEVLAYREAALDFSDIEGVHDMRVASRRLRSALRDFAPRLRRSRRLERARDELKTLARVLGAVRDQDVALAALGKLEREAPEEARAGVRLLAAGREARRDEARALLTEALAAEALDELRRRFERAVAEAEWSPPGRRGREGGDGGEAGESFAELGRWVVARLWGELRGLSPSLYRPHKERRLHRMRIAAKRLRYALELYSACWGDEARQLASEISDLQDAIGHLHDCDEWMAEVGERLARAAGDSGAGDGRAGAGAEARPGLVWLLDHFAAERAKNYREALKLWHEWERGGFAERIAAVSQK